MSVINGDKYSTDIKCTVIAYPQATVTWEKKGQEIVPSDRIKISDGHRLHTLIIPDTTYDDFAEYKCSASNSMGTKEATYELFGQPTVAKYIDGSADNNRNITLNWEIESASPIIKHELLYRKKGVSIKVDLSPDKTVLINSASFQTNDWVPATPSLTKPVGSIYKIKHKIINLDVGEYEAKVRSQNQHGWSKFSKSVPFKGGTF